MECPGKDDLQKRELLHPMKIDDVTADDDVAAVEDEEEAYVESSKAVPRGVFTL